MNKNLVLIISAILILFGFLFLILGPAPAKDEGVVEVVEEKQDVFNKIPEFSLEDYKGNTVTEKDFAGKIMVVNSWAVWCPFCVKELDDFAELQKAFPDEVVVVAINRSESLEKAKGFTDDLGLSSAYTYLIDPDDSFYESIGGFAMPETLFVDTEGNIRIHKRGPMTFLEMKEKVETLLKTN